VERCTNHCAITAKRCARWPSWRSSLLGDPGSKCLCGQLEKAGRKKKSIQKKEKKHTRKKRDGIRTTELNHRDQVTAAKSWPSFHRKTGAEVDYQVAAPTELGTPTMHRAKIAQPRVRMEGWRQRRPGSNARNPQEGRANRKSKQKEQTERANRKSKLKEKNTLDSYRPSHGRT
jgi:hypothetical protein